jgi:hypothetical protein
METITNPADLSVTRDEEIQTDDGAREDSCPWCTGTGKFASTLFARVTCGACAGTGKFDATAAREQHWVCTGLGKAAPSSDPDPDAETSKPFGVYAQFLQAIQARGAVYCATCRMYLYPEHAQIHDAVESQ